MSANPNMVVIRKVVVTDQDLCEMRLLVDDGTHDFTKEVADGGDGAAIDWLENHPTDAIILDPVMLGVPKGGLGEIISEESDDDGDLVALSLDFSLIDEKRLKGIINGSPVEIDLGLENTSWVARYIKTNPDATIHVWLSWINPTTKARIECFYAGEIDKDRITSEPYLFDNQTQMTATQDMLQKYHFTTDTIVGRLQKLFIQNLVESIDQSDMFTSDKEATYDGSVVAEGYGYFKDVNGVFSDDVDTHGRNKTQFQQTRYPKYTFPNEDAINGGDINSLNPYLVKSGFQYLTYKKLIDKVGELAHFITDVANSDRTFALYMPKLNNVSDSVGTLGAGATGYGIQLHNYTTTFDFHPLTFICKNYNVLFGVRPDAVNPLIFGFMPNDFTTPVDTTGNALGFRVNSFAQGSSSFEFTVLGSSFTTLPFYIGQEVVLYIPSTGGSDTGFCGAGKITNVVDVFSDGTLFHMFCDGTLGAPIKTLTGTEPDMVVEVASEDWYKMTSPVTYERTATLSTFLTDICRRWGYIMEWDIGQSGLDSGVPILVLKDILKSSGDAPASWADGSNPKLLDGAQTTTSKKKTCVALRNKGFDTVVYCPHKPKVGEEAIEIEIMSSAKQWGHLEKPHTSDFIYDRNKDTGEQITASVLRKVIDPAIFNYAANYDIYGYVYGDDFWIPASRDLFRLKTTDDYPGLTTFHGGEYLDPPFYAEIVSYNSDNKGNLYFETTVGADPDQDGFDDTGFYSGCYEEYNNWVRDTFSANPNYYNTLVSKAIIYANVLLRSMEVDVRLIKGVRDDSGSTRKLLRRLKTSWRDELGNIVYKRSSKTYINIESGFVTVHFVESKADESAIDLLDYEIVNGGANAGGVVGGQAGGATGGKTGGTGSSATDAVIRNATTNTYNSRTTEKNVQIAESILEGTVAEGEIELQISNTSNDNVNILDTDNKAYIWIRCITDGSLSATTNLTGINASLSTTLASVNGNIHKILNQSGFDIVIKHNDSNSDTHKRFRTPDGNDFTLSNGYYIEIRYKQETTDADSRWEIISEPIPNPVITGAGHTVESRLTTGTGAMSAEFLDTFANALYEFLIDSSTAGITLSTDSNRRTLVDFSSLAFLTYAIIQDPQTNSFNKILSSVANIIGLTIQAKSGDTGTGTAFQITDSSGLTLTKFLKNGALNVTTVNAFAEFISQLTEGQAVRRLATANAVGTSLEDTTLIEKNTTGASTTSLLTIDCSVGCSYRIEYNLKPRVRGGAAGTVGITNSHYGFFTVENVSGTITIDASEALIGIVRQVGTGGGNTSITCTNPSGTNISINAVNATANVNFTIQGKLQVLLNT